MNGCYNPEVAKQGALQVMSQLTALKLDLASALDATNEMVLTSEQFNSFFQRYDDIPSFEINWAAADLDPKAGHDLATEIREQLQNMTGIIRINQFIPARFVS